MGAGAVADLPALAATLAPMQTCRARDINPQALLEDLFRRVLDHWHKRLAELLHERQVRRVLTEYLAHYHAERAHQGLAGQLIQPSPPADPVPGATVVRRPRLGGLLNYYHSEAA